MRAQFMGDPLYLQTDKYRAMPVELDEIKSVFRRVENTRSAAPESVSSQLDASCVFGRFVSSNHIGFVCFDGRSGKLNSFYESSNSTE